jgi:hypothetical protein
VTGRVIVLFGGRFDVVLDAGCASSCLQKLPVSNFVAGVAFGGSEVLGWDWTSSSGEMSSNGCFLKVDWGRRILQWFETAAKERSMDTFALESVFALVYVLNLKVDCTESADLQSYCWNIHTFQLGRCASNAPPGMELF